MTFPDGKYYMIFENAPRDVGRHLDALGALRRIGILSANENSFDSWVFTSGKNEPYQFHPWGVPKRNKKNVVVFKVNFQNENGDSNISSISFIRAVNKDGVYLPKIKLISNKTSGLRSPDKWEYMVINDIGNIENMFLKFDEKGEIIVIDGNLKKLPEGVNSKKLKVDMTQEDMTPERRSEERKEVLNQVNQALDMEDRPIGINNLNPGIIINECLKRRNPVDSNLIKSAINS